MDRYLILRLRNAAIVYDEKNDFNMASLLTETIEELERYDEQLRNLWNKIKEIAS